VSQHQTETIVALSSGAVPSGVAVIRVSGPRCRSILESSIGMVPVPRQAVLKVVRDLDSNVIDEGLVLWFPGPASYTGEDCVEFQMHGGRAVVSSMLDFLCSQAGVRVAEAGEFSRRAFENGRLDLTAVDGVADLIASETQAQRRLALSQSQGNLRDLYEGWRKQVIYIRAMLEAEFDFSDEEDVPEEISAEGLNALSVLVAEIEIHLDDNRAGEIIRDGFRIALMGKPNAGKSSLLNVLAKRDIAIVTDSAGTTRDVLEVDLDIDGNKVVVFDTAGLRQTDDIVESEGIRRAHDAGDRSDLVIWLNEDRENCDVEYFGSTEVLTVGTKIDMVPAGGLGISVRSSAGLETLIREISKRVSKAVSSSEPGLITRKRYRDGLIKTVKHLKNVQSHNETGLELRAEECRLAGIELGKLTGKVDVEDLLDVIFSEFCIGK